MHWKFCVQTTTKTHIIWDASWNYCESGSPESHSLPLGTAPSDRWALWTLVISTWWDTNLFSQVQSPLDDGSLIMSKIPSSSSLTSHNPTLHVLILMSCQRFVKHMTCTFLTTTKCMWRETKHKALSHKLLHLSLNLPLSHGLKQVP
jgi:hypothetical protein